MRGDLPTMPSFSSYEDVQKARKTLSDESFQHWIHYDLLTWKWWILLILTIVPWFIWFKIVEKKRVHEILAFGLIISILAVLLDTIGLICDGGDIIITYSQLIP
jgi:hypothetical protein